jgi:hypothetical protein
LLIFLHTKRRSYSIYCCPVCCNFQIARERR